MSKRAHSSRKKSAGGVDSALPALSSLSDIPPFSLLTPSERQKAAFGTVLVDERDRAGVSAAGQPAVASDLHLGCVVRLDRGFPAIAWEDGLVRAEFSAGLTKGADDSRVAVGDWVVLRVPEGHDKAQIEAILPRESDVARWRGGARGERQTLAANVDIVLVAQALGPRRISVDRLARSAVIAADCGTRVAVVFTKADRAELDVLKSDLALVRAVLSAEVPVVVTSSAHDGAGVQDVRALVPPGTVAIVLGESGAGKSTLLNALLGHEALETGAVRARDDKGRHTTVARRMVALPGGGVIIDEPGLRSLPLVGHERGLRLVFPAIAEAALGCRFRDCTHTHEPGCAVREALAAGAFTPEALEAYLALAGEMRESAALLDPDIVL
ncbi:MAG: ribosome small subunit-dependent GTPase A [Olegusella sp.]|nr:ribosome small subunit-dependent GTPase A [Olegusella sp.]